MHTILFVAVENKKNKYLYSEGIAFHGEKTFQCKSSLKSYFVSVGFFSVWVFSHDHSRITGLQGKGEGISLTPHYHFHLLHRHLDSRVITAESSPLHIVSTAGIKPRTFGFRVQVANH